MIKIKFDGATDTGRVRSNNEDSYAVQYIDDESRVLCLVIDGIGGYEGGEVAAEITRHTIISHLEENRAGSLVERLKAAMTAANNAIVNKATTNPQLSSMGCVATAAIIDPEEATLTIAHIGDTRLYRYSNGKLTKLTHDHSIVGYREEIGQLSELEAMRHPNRNLIERSLGEGLHNTDDQNFLEAANYAIDESCTLLLCSDGLCDMITSDQMCHELAKPLPLSDIASQLIESANQAGGRDNITVVLAQIIVDRPTELKPKQQPAFPARSEVKTAETVTVTDYDHKPFPMVSDNPAVSSSDTKLSASNETDDNEDIPHSKSTTPRNLAIALCIAVVVFFAGYYAAMERAREKVETVQSELNVCRSTLTTTNTENKLLKDSINSLNQQFGLLKQLLTPALDESAQFTDEIPSLDPTGDDNG